MPGRSNLLIGLFLLTLVASVASLYQLFSLRFEAGDLFPAGSSLRSDPLGSMALYRALEQTGSLQLSRNYRPLNHQQIDNSTILMLGSGTPLLYQRQNASGLDRLAAAGNRVVIAFTPVSKAPAASPRQQADDDCADEQEQTAWGLTIGLLPITPQQPEGSMIRAALADPSLALPQEALFISRLTLQPPATGWRTVYAAEGRPLVLERTIGRGSLVLVADSSIFSNEALKAGRQAVLLTWLLGDQHRIVFDEAHLGVTEQGGVMSLARRFGLLPLLGALLLVAGLYIWQQSIPLTPVGETPDAGPLGVAHDSFSGLVHLLRRNIPAKRLLTTCCTEWRKSFTHELQQDQTLQTELDDAMASTDDPVGRYQRIARLWAERKRR